MKFEISGIYNDYVTIEENGKKIYQGHPFILMYEDKKVLLKFSEKEKYELKVLTDNVVVALPTELWFQKSDTNQRYIFTNEEFQKIVALSFFDLVGELPKVNEGKDILLLWMMEFNYNYYQIGDSILSSIDRFLNSIVAYAKEEENIQKMIHNLKENNTFCVVDQSYLCHCEQVTLYLDIGDQVVEWDGICSLSNNIYFKIYKGLYVKMAQERSMLRQQE